MRTNGMRTYRLLVLLAMLAGPPAWPAAAAEADAEPDAETDFIDRVGTLELDCELDAASRMAQLEAD